MLRVLAVIAFFLWVVSFLSDSGSPPPSAPSMLPPPLRASLEVLGLIKRVVQINEANASVVIPPNQVVREPTDFRPHDFMSKHSIRSSSDAERTRQKLERVVIRCSEEALAGGEKNLVRWFDKRAACLSRNGMDRQDAAYIGAFLN